jgi:hypothetical protein
VHLDAPFGEQAGDLLGGAVFLETEFGMGVDVAADLDEARGVGKRRSRRCSWRA